MVVTGSRIARPDYDSPSPVVSLSEETFALSGELQLETVLNTMPQVVASITTTSNNPSNGGQANIDLRGLGTVRTLVLLDGTRLTPSNVTGVVDLNTIPQALIQNVEILTGGASSVYGSDAIAGVVNIRLRNDFEGVRSTRSTASPTRAMVTDLLFEGLIGGNFAEDRGNAVLAISYDTRDEVLAGARASSARSRAARRCSHWARARCRTAASTGAPLKPAGGPAISNAPSRLRSTRCSAPTARPQAQSRRPAAIGFNTDGTLFSFGRGNGGPAGGELPGNKNDPGFNPLSYSYNFGPVNYLQLPSTRRQIAGFATYDIVPDVVEAYTRIMYTTYIGGPAAGLDAGDLCRYDARAARCRSPTR